MTTERGPKNEWMVLAILLAGCLPQARPATTAPTLEPSFRERFYSEQDRRSSCEAQLDILKAEISKYPGRSHVRMTADDVNRFDGKKYAVFVNGARCWPDVEPLWMWCEAGDK